MLEKAIDRFFAPLERVPRIEASGGEGFTRMDIRPAEDLSIWGIESIPDALSLHIQGAIGRLGIVVPDIRFRAITNINTDGLYGWHFGSLPGAIKAAEAASEKLSAKFKAWQRDEKQS